MIKDQAKEKGLLLQCSVIHLLSEAVGAGWLRYLSSLGNPRKLYGWPYAHNYNLRKRHVVLPRRRSAFETRVTVLDKENLFVLKAQ